MLCIVDMKMEEGSICRMLWMLPLKYICSYVDKSLMNVDTTNQFGGCPKEGGKQGNMSMYESESNYKDKESSL